MTVWYVRARAMGGDGSEGAPFGTLAAANTAAKAGDEVVVSPGIFRERLALKTARVTWRSEERWGAVIDGGWDGTLPDGDDDGVFANQVGLGAEEVQVIGFTIRNCMRGAYLAGRATLLQNCRIDNCATAAVVIGDAMDATVDGCICTRMGMAWEAGRRPSVSGSVILVRATGCTVRRCVVAYGYGEGIDIGRGSRDCLVSECLIFDNAHLALYFNRCVNCIAEGNVLFLTGFERRNVGDGGWPAGVVFGDEGSENMRTNPHSEGNTFRGNLVINAGTLLQVRNNRANYDTRLDDKTVIEQNTFVAGACTETGWQVNANQHGRPHGPARVAGNVTDMTRAPAGADIVRGGEGLAWENNAWSRQPPVQARCAVDIIGDLGLSAPGASLANEFPAAGHSLRLDNYRPACGSQLLDAMGSAGYGALQPLAVEPPLDDEEPPVVVDWEELIGQAMALDAQMAAWGEALDAVRAQLVVMDRAHEEAVAVAARLLERLGEYRAKVD